MPLLGEGRDTCSGGKEEDHDGKIDTNDEDCRCGFREVSATSSIDWNINGSIEGAGASLNIDTPIMDPKHKCLTAVPNQKAHGWDDWHNLKLNFRGARGNYSDGLPNVPLPEEQELPPVPTGPSRLGPVGGIAELPDVSDSSAPNYIALAALAALTAGAWYARAHCLS